MLFLFTFLDEASRKCEFPNVASIVFLFGSAAKEKCLAFVYRVPFSMLCSWYLQGASCVQARLKSLR